MPSLLYHRRTLIAAAHPNYIRITNLPRCKLRLINCQDYTDVALITAQIIQKNASLAGAIESLALFQRQQQIAAAVDVGWEGDIDLGHDQDLLIVFEDTPDVAPTAGDLLYVTVGYERLW